MALPHPKNNILLSRFGSFLAKAGFLFQKIKTESLILFSILSGLLGKNAEGGTRTLMSRAHTILSRACLPVPPLRPIILFSIFIIP